MRSPMAAAWLLSPRQSAVGFAQEAVSYDIRRFASPSDMWLKCTNSAEGPAGSASTRRPVILRLQPLARSTRLSDPSSRRCIPPVNGSIHLNTRRSVLWHRALCGVDDAAQKGLEPYFMLVQCLCFPAFPFPSCILSGRASQEDAQE